MPKSIVYNAAQLTQSDVTEAQQQQHLNPKLQACLQEPPACSSRPTWAHSPVVEEARYVALDCCVDAAQQTGAL